MPSWRSWLASRTGQHDHAVAFATQAEAAARAITSGAAQGDGLAKVAGGLAQAGQYAQAMAVASSITHPNLHAHALAQISEALAQISQALTQVGEVRSAARAAAVVCAMGAWPTAVAPVLLLVPSAITPLSRTLEEQQRSHSDLAGH